MIRHLTRHTLSRQVLCTVLFGTCAFQAGSAPQDEPPTAAAILERMIQVTGGEEAYAKCSNRVERVTIRPANSGITISMTGYYARPLKASLSIEADILGSIQQGTDGEVAWETSSRAGPSIMKGAERDLFLRAAVFDRATQWRELFDTAETVGVVTVEGKPCHQVALTATDGPSETHYYEQSTGLLLKVDTFTSDAGTVELFLDDYRMVDGLLVPHQYRRVSLGQVMHYTVDSREHDVELPPGCFDRPDSIEALLSGAPVDPRQRNLESFDRTWNLIHDHYWDPDFGGVDWAAVRDELRPRMAEASTISEARAVLSEMVARLGRSHFAIVPAKASSDLDAPAPARGPSGETGLDARVIEGRALVTSVAPDSPAARVGVKRGWQLLKIDDFDVVANLRALDRQLPETPSKRVKMAAETVVRIRSGGGESISITVRMGDGEVAQWIVPLTEPRGRLAPVGNFGQARVRVDVETLRDTIGCIAIDKFLDPEYVATTLSDALESFREADGVILDLRGNSGGKDAIAMDLLGRLTKEDWTAGRIRMRGREIEMVVRPSAEPFDGPLAVLTDGLTGSSAEFVAAALQERGRAHVIGTRTKGEALPGEYLTLPNGDTLLYAVADFVTGEGASLEGVGVAPDLEVALTQDSLLEGRDLVLEAAVEWIASQRKKGA